MAAQVSKAFSFEFPNFNFLCRTRTSTSTRTSLLHVRKASQSLKLFDMLQLQNDPSIFRLQISCTFTLRCMSTTSNQHSFTVSDPSILSVSKSNTLEPEMLIAGSNQDSFTASYLINKLGFSPQSALKASQYVKLKSPDNADTVISFLEKQGFSQSQIKKMVRVNPALLASSVEKTFLPKWEYLLSKGFSRPDLAKLISLVPNILHRSLERHIIPFFNAYSNLVHSDENTVKAIKAYPFLISSDTKIINGKLLPNINFLRDYGVPESNIIKLLYQFPSALLIDPGRLKEIVEKLEEIGLDPLILKFVNAVSVLARIKKSTRERKFDTFKKWGWSEKEIWDCFGKYPFYFVASEDMIMAKMDFLVNKMGIDSSCVVNQPSVLRQSLKTNIIPRGLFVQKLLSKGLIKDFRLSALFDTSEENFLKKFVVPHVAEAPELLKLYEEEKLKKLKH